MIWIVISVVVAFAAGIWIGVLVGGSLAVKAMADVDAKQRRSYDELVDKLAQRER